jgi:hypothetical protein
MFQLEGSPSEVGAYFEAEVGSSFLEMQRDMLAATYVQAESGIYGFEGLVSFNARPEPRAFGSGSIDLFPYQGALLAAPTNGLAIAGAGAQVQHLAVDLAGQVDATAPYDVSGGVVVALSGEVDPTVSTTEPSGELVVTLAPTPVHVARPRASAPALDRRMLLHPPPLNPKNGHASARAWRRAVHGY